MGADSYLVHLYIHVYIYIFLSKEYPITFQPKYLSFLQAPSDLWCIMYIWEN